MIRTTLLPTLPLLLAVALPAFPGCGRREAPSRKKQRRVVVRQLNVGTKTGEKTTAKSLDDDAKTKKQPRSKKPKFALRPITPPKTVRLDDVTPKALKEFIAKQTANSSPRICGRCLATNLRRGKTSPASTENGVRARR